MKDKVKAIYSKFDKRRKEADAIQADEDDLKELKQLEKELKRR